jgi:hypothetical protein
MTQQSFPPVVFASALSVLLGCSKAHTEKTGEAEPDGGDQAFVETQPTGSVAWNVRPSGEVEAALRTQNGEPLPAPVTGTLVWTAPGRPPQTTPIAYADGTLTATGPKLTADVTEVSYDLDANGTPWTGVLQVPPGGTQQIAVDAQAGTKLDVPEGKLGPHGGRIQVVGPDRLELVSSPGTGEVRVYVLDPSFAPIPIGHRRVTLGVVADRSEVVALEPDPGGLYFGAVWGIGVDPWRLDASMRVGSSVYFGVWGYAPGVPVFVGPAAPRYAVRVATGWGAPVLRGSVLVSTPRVELGTGFPRAGFRGGFEVGGGVRVEGLHGGGPALGPQARPGEAPHLFHPAPELRREPARGPAREPERAPQHAPERGEPERGGGHRR